MKALVLGLGISGKSVSHFLQKMGWEVVAVDDKLCPKEIKTIEEFDLFVPSPGISQKHPLYQRAVTCHLPIKGEMQLALENAVQPCLAVTGTNGKTTVVKMVEHCLRFAGKKAKAVGNVGLPITEHIGDPEEILVVEISSYQLETLTAQVFEAGVILNITEDHLNRYSSFYEYAKTKALLARCIKESGKLFIHSEIDKTLFSSPIQEFEGTNEKAAMLLCQSLGVTEKQCTQALLSFSKPLHRIEFVANCEGVAYYNDSKATNVASVMYALYAFSKKVILLAGGQDKNLSFTPLRELVKFLDCVVVFGEAREKIANALQDLVSVYRVETVLEAVLYTKKIAKHGQIVLFSPGCSSLDAFKNYEERGAMFKNYVRQGEQ